MKQRSSLMLLFLAVSVFGCQGSNAGANRQRPPEDVKYQLPVLGRVIDYADFPGSTDAKFSVQVTARVSGYMTKVYFTDGTQVKKDDPLFQIDPQQFKAELDRAEGNFKQIEAHKWRLEREWRRARNLLAMSKVSQEEYDHYEADFKETEANLKLAQGNLDLARLNYEWTEVRSPLTGLLSRRMVDPGNLIKADNTVLTSIVSQDPMYVYFDVDEQNTLHHVRRLIRDGKIKATSEKAVPVLVGLSDEISKEALPLFPHQGIVDFTDNHVDVNTGSLRFRAVVRNENGILTPGLFVRVRLPISDPHDTLFVREEALMRDQGRKIVYVLVDNAAPPADSKGRAAGSAPAEVTKSASGPRPKFKVETRQVEIGSLRGKFRAIESGLKADDKIVVSGLQRIKTGSEVNATLNPTTEKPPEEVAFQFQPPTVDPSPTLTAKRVPATPKGERRR
jgi:membrane fusion protein, multidrug efflux system